MCNYYQVLLKGIAITLFPTVVFADPLVCTNRINDTPAELRECVTENGIRTHLEMLQSIANSNGGIRTSGTPGFDASLQYVSDKLTAAGYVVTKQTFPYNYFEELTPPLFELISPISKVYAGNSVDYVTADYSSSGNITAPVQPVGGIIIPATLRPSSASGCTTADFVGFVPGNIALIQRGTCNFSVKALNAKAAGASAVIIFNEGQVGRQEVIAPTLSDPRGIPVIGTSYAVGVELYQMANPITHLSINALNEKRITANLLAETASGRSRSVIMAGAHLDSVKNAGINDNGSGVASLLEIALQMKGINPLNKIRFAFWGAEEAGLKGSEYYVLNQMQKGRLNDIEIYLNFDMVGSPNHILDIFDASPNIGGYSKSIVTNMNTATKLFEDYFSSVGEPFKPRNGDPNFFDRGDHQNFVEAGIPIGGLDLGADDIKTPEEVALFGGTAGIFADPCYHKTCDDINNVNTPLTARMADAIATVIATYAYDKKADGSDGAINYDPSQPKGERKGQYYFK